MSDPVIHWKNERIENGTECAIYRFFRADGKLLYVGISSAPLRRITTHKPSAEWFSSAASCEIHWLESREHALNAEIRAIETESPLHNSGRSGGRPPMPPSQKRVTVHMTLPQAIVERARQIGAGNVSAGVEIAVMRTKLSRMQAQAREIRERIDGSIDPYLG